MKAVLTVMGEDKPGIVARISTRLYEYNSNILDVTQTVMQGEIFTMIMVVDLDNINVSFPEFKAGLEACAQEIGMELSMQREEIFHSMHRI